MQNLTQQASFAARLADAYGEHLDGIRPILQRVSMRVRGKGRHAELELKNSQTQAVEIWPAAKLRIVPDQAGADSVVIARSDQSPARLIIRDPEAARNLLSSLPHMPDLGAGGVAWGKVGALAMLALALIGAILFFLVPYVAARGASLVPPEAEQALGNAAMEQFYADGISGCKSGEGAAALATMQARIMEGVTLPYPLEVQVVRDPRINAFAVPGGQVVLFSGLIEVAETPDEVAAVLAHEIGHVVHRHGTEAMLRAMGSFGLVGLLFGDAFGATGAGATASALIDAAHSRAAEEEADAFARRQLALAGLPPAALGDMFRRMQAAGLDPDMGVFRHFATHPGLMERIAAAEAEEAAPAGPPALDDAEWAALRRICN